MLIDAIFALLLLLACIKGYRTGLVVAFFSMLAFIAGLAAALKLSSEVAQKLSGQVAVSAKWLPLISFMLVFLVVVILVNIGARLIKKSFEFAMLGWVDKLGGMLFYILLYIIILSIFLFYGVQLYLVKDQTVHASRAYPLLQPIGPAVINKLGTAIPFFKDMFMHLQDFFSGIANKMQH